MKRIISIYNRYKEVINYLIFGFLTTLVNLVIYYLLTYTIINPNNVIELQIANIISWIVAVLFAYITNRKYVFNSKNNNIKKEVINFFEARIVTLIMDMLIMGIFVSVLGFNDEIIKILSQIIVIVSNYLFSKLFVFKKDDNNEK